jgi:hypothetical protein
MVDKKMEITASSGLEIALVRGIVCITTDFESPLTLVTCFGNLWPEA